MAGDPVALIERLAADAWPAATVGHADGWLLRATPGVARRRSNSALPPPSAATAGPARLAGALDRAERFYAARDQPAVVQVSPAERHARLDRELAARGYRRQAPTVVSTAPLDGALAGRPPAPAMAVSVADAVTPRWLAAWTAVEARPDAEATASQVLARIRPRTGFLAATGDAGALGVALLVVEPPWAGLFCLATHPEARRRGVATALLRAGAAWAATLAARHLYLQVEEDNLPARRLFTRLGFRPSHHYHYRVRALPVSSGGRPGAAPPASRGS